MAIKKEKKQTSPRIPQLESQIITLQGHVDTLTQQNITLIGECKKKDDIIEALTFQALQAKAYSDKLATLVNNK